MRWLLFATLFLLFVFGCKQCDPIPTPPWPGACRGDVGGMLRAHGLIFSVHSCYACEHAAGCFTEGGHYCCENPMCFECRESPVPFDSTKPRDAGTGDRQ